jgi:hypothetical protein
LPILATTCPASCQPSCSPLPSSGSVGAAIIPPLQALYDGPYAVLCRGPRSFTIRVRSRNEVVAVSRLKAYTAADAAPGSPPRCGRPPGSRPGGPAVTKRVSFSDPLVSSPSSSRAPPQNGPRTVFSYPARRFCIPGTGGAFTASTDAVPVPSTDTAQEVRPLTYSPSSRGQSLGGALWTAGNTPVLDRLTSWVYSTTCCTVPVYKLLIIRQ